MFLDFQNQIFKLIVIKFIFLPQIQYACEPEMNKCLQDADFTLLIFLNEKNNTLFSIKKSFEFVRCMVIFLLFMGIILSYLYLHRLLQPIFMGS